MGVEGSDRVLAQKVRQERREENMVIDIPGWGQLTLNHVVFDMNGTLSVDGIVPTQVKQLLKSLCNLVTVHVLTADTFGTARAQFDGLDINVEIITDNVTENKAKHVELLGASNTAAVGNGNNDRLMFKTAALSILVIGHEGCSREALHEADIIVQSPIDAINLFLQPKRLIATLRR